MARPKPEAQIGEFHQPETHLIPVILEAIDGERDALTIHGTDYDTPDGTCIRDYVHVMDLVEAHALGLGYLSKGGETPRVFNLGTGRGFSVREVMCEAEAVAAAPVPVNEGPRRAGDATQLVSGSERSGEELGWNAQRSSLGMMIGDALRWKRSGGYTR